MLGLSHRMQPAGLVALIWSVSVVGGWQSVVRADDLELLEQRAFRVAVDRVAASVVAIETVGGLDRVGGVAFEVSTTTGLAIDPDGYILSSAFAFLNLPSSILVRLPDGSRHAARLVATDHNRQIALVKIQTHQPLAVPEWAPRDQMRVGQWAIAVGRTFDVRTPNVAVGIVSATHRIWGMAIQTDAAVSPNNYGGPLIDVRGRVLGLIVPLAPDKDSEIAGVAWYDSGIGFAVPLDGLDSVVAKLKLGKDLYHGVIGIGFAGTGPFTAEPVIAAVLPGSAAEKAGLEKGDRLVAIDDSPIARASDVREAVGPRYAGESVRVAVLRDGKQIEYDVVLGRNGGN